LLIAPQVKRLCLLALIVVSPSDATLKDRPL